MRKLTASVLAFALALGAGVALLTTVPPAAAAKIELRKEVREKFVAAQTAGQKGNFNEAIKLLKEAKAIGGLKPDQEYAVNELLIWAASSAHDWALVAATIEERLATGRVTDKLQKRYDSIQDATARFSQHVKFGFSKIEQDFVGTLKMNKTTAINRMESLIAGIQSGAIPT